MNSRAYIQKTAKFCRKNLRTFSADYFGLKSKIRRHFYFLDVCLAPPQLALPILSHRRTHTGTYTGNDKDTHKLARPNPGNVLLDLAICITRRLDTKCIRSGAFGQNTCRGLRPEYMTRIRARSGGFAENLVPTQKPIEIPYHNIITLWLFRMIFL